MEMVIGKPYVQRTKNDTIKLIADVILPGGASKKSG